MAPGRQFLMVRSIAGQSGATARTTRCCRVAVTSPRWRRTASDRLALGEVDAVYRGWTNYFGEHSTGWMGSPVGILALLRAGKARDSGTELIEARWQNSDDVSPELALELARAWSEEGLPEQSWLELAMACGGSRANGPMLAAARETAYLNHRERMTLLCSLGHLGEEGRAALHAIISQTYNYRQEVTDRHIGRLPPWPISCPKIRELHPEATASGACTCQFRLRAGGYPTPVLYALKPSQVAAFRDRRRKSEKKDPAAKARPGRKQAKGDQLIRKIADLKRQRRGIEGAIARVTGELAELFDAANSDTLALSIGTLRKVQASDGETWDFLIEV